MKVVILNLVLISLEKFSKINKQKICSRVLYEGAVTVTDQNKEVVRFTHVVQHSFIHSNNIY